MFRLQSTCADSPYVHIHTFVCGKDFFNLTTRRIGGVILDGSHPALGRQRHSSIKGAITKVQSLGWEVEAEVVA